MRDIKYTLWFNKIDLTVRNEKLMNEIYFVKEYDIEDNLDMIAIRFKAPFSQRNRIMDKAFKVGATIISVGTYEN